MSQLKEYNDGNIFLLTVVDVYQVWICQTPVKEERLHYIESVSRDPHI